MQKVTYLFICISTYPLESMKTREFSFLEGVICVRFSLHCLHNFDEKICMFKLHRQHLLDKAAQIQNCGRNVG